MGRDRRKIKARRSRPQKPKPAVQAQAAATRAYYPMLTAATSSIVDYGYSRGGIASAGEYRFPTPGASYLRG